MAIYPQNQPLDDQAPATLRLVYLPKTNTVTGIFDVKRAFRYTGEGLDTVEAAHAALTQLDYQLEDDDWTLTQTLRHGGRAMERTKTRVYVKLASAGVRGAGLVVKEPEPDMETASYSPRIGDTVADEKGFEGVVVAIEGDSGFVAVRYDNAYRTMKSVSKLKLLHRADPLPPDDDDDSVEDDADDEAVEAFSARQIMDAKKNALKGRAILTITAQTAHGQVMTGVVGDIRWSDRWSRPEVYNGHTWMPVTDEGIQAWAAEESLNWLRPDGSIFIGKAPGTLDVPQPPVDVPVSAPDADDRDDEPTPAAAQLDAPAPAFNAEAALATILGDAADQPADPHPENVRDSAGTAAPALAAEPAAADVHPENVRDTVQSGAPPTLAERWQNQRFEALFTALTPGQSVEAVLRTTEIVTNAGSQTRAGLDDETIEAYRAARRGGAQFPNVVVFWDDEIHRFILSRGFHRVEMYRRDGDEYIVVDLRRGTLRDATLYGMDNHTHGKPATLADRRAAALKLLADPEWSQWSNSEIARRSGFSAPSIARLRDEMVGDAVPGERIVQRGGSTYTMTIPARPVPGGKTPDDDQRDDEVQQRFEALVKTHPESHLFERFVAHRNGFSGQYTGVYRLVDFAMPLQMRMLAQWVSEYFTIHEIGINLEPTRQAQWTWDRNLLMVRFSAQPMDGQQRDGLIARLEKFPVGSWWKNAKWNDVWEVTSHTAHGLRVRSGGGPVRDVNNPLVLDSVEPYTPPAPDAPPVRSPLATPAHPFQRLRTDPLPEKRQPDSEPLSVGGITEQMIEAVIDDGIAMMQSLAAAKARQANADALSDERRHAIEEKAAELGDDSEAVEAALDDVTTTDAEPVAQPDSAPTSATRTGALFTSDSVEWYTPADIAADIRDFLVPCDEDLLDPASCIAANATLKASRIYTSDDDGLTQSWAADALYLNPPYGRGVIEPWIAKLVSEYEAGSFAEALALIPARTETAWYQSLRRYPKCFIAGRLAFTGPDDKGNGATFPSVLVYLGEHADEFFARFESYGEVVVPYSFASQALASTTAEASEDAA